MNKKIKVIELYERLSKQENMPEKIKYMGLIFNREYDGFENVYFYQSEQGTQLLKIINAVQDLNGEVEILEDEEEIDIQDIDIIRDYRTSDDDLYNDNFGDFKSTINDLVKAVKQLDKKINKED